MGAGNRIDISDPFPMRRADCLAIPQKENTGDTCRVSTPLQRIEEVDQGFLSFAEHRIINRRAVAQNMLRGCSDVFTADNDGRVREPIANGADQMLQYGPFMREGAGDAEVVDVRRDLFNDPLRRPTVRYGIAAGDRVNLVGRLPERVHDAHGVAALSNSSGEVCMGEGRHQNSGREAGL